MGESALKSHMGGKKHKERVQPKQTVIVIDHKQSLILPETGNNEVSNEFNSEVTPVNLVMTTAVQRESVATKNDVLSAELLWTMKLCSAHYSHKSSEHSDLLFQKMFPDSAIASSFKCGEVKSSYLINHGIAPHFKSLLSDKMNEKDCTFVLLFDESMNGKTQDKQMDFHLRIWEGQEVRTRYYHSEFMGHATAEDMDRVFETATSGLHMSNCLQFSMDGPNVNWKFYEIVQKRLQKEYTKSMLNTGSCGLHIVHGAFKHGVDASGWNVDEFLKSVHWLLKDTPARREDYAKAVQSESPLMPLRFCKTRWTENVPVVERAIEMLPHLRLYVQAVLEKKSPDPKTKSFDVVKDCCSDKLMEAKLSFYRLIGQQLKPYLTLYQTERPMMPFMSSDLLDLLKSLMSRVIKADVMKTAASNICDVNVTDVANQVNYKNVDIGFSADRMLKKLVKDKKCSERQEMEFRQSAKAFVVSMLSRLLMKSPLTYTLVRNLSFLDPRLMVTSTEGCKTKFKRVLNVLIEANRVDEKDCDDILNQFGRYMEEIPTRDVSVFSNFKPSESRLDTLMYQTMNDDGNYCKLWNVIRQLLLLSHGQAQVERGFSINRQLEIENLKHMSYVAHRTVCDHLEAVGGLMNVSITKELLRAASAARMKYQVYLEENKKKQVCLVVQLYVVFFL